MPAEPHPVFEPLDDITTPIWRYMDFTKFVEMLNSATLYFARADLLGDPFEGTVPKGNAAPDGSGGGAASLRKQWRTWVYVNCWHANPFESAAMWRLYAKSNDAIAIKSNYQALSLALSKEARLGKVNYIDFASASIPRNNLLYPFIHKRMSYAHEHEVRAVIPPASDENLVNVDAPTEGIRMRVELHMLIHAVYVAPTTMPWYRELVKDLCTKYGLGHVPVLQSTLDDEPVY